MSIGSLTLGLALAATGADSAVDPVSWEELCAVPSGHSVHQFSSHNKEGRNGDDGWHLYDDEKGHAVIFDVEGPGCLKSMWSTDIREDAVLHFTFDGEEEARYSIPMIGFFKGEHEHFPTPLVSFERRGYWGDRPFAGNSFVPIPFAKGLRISVSGELHFHHSIWESYPHGTEVETFTGEEDRAALFNAFGGNHDWRSQRMMAVAFAKAEWSAIEPDQEVVLADLDRSSPACVRRIEIEAENEEALIREAWIQMVFDDHDRLDVRAPLGHFFGSAVRATEMRSMPLRVELLESGRVRLTSHFRMPFVRRARISLVNRSSQPLGPLRSVVVSK